MSKKKAYVVGSSVSNSLSPLIFDYWFKKYKIDGEYTHKEIEDKSFDEKIKPILEEDGLCGINITTPFKEKIIPYLTKLDKEAQNIGAVNCVTKNNNLLGGTNTDLVGFIKSYQSKEWGWNFSEIVTSNHNSRAIVLGFGGAAKAIIYSLYYIGFKEVKVFNRTFEKIKNESTKLKFQPHKLNELEKHIGCADLIVNTIPLNVLKIYINKKLIRNTMGFDVVYKPRGGTGFLDYFEQHNRIEGIYMLVYQAAPCFKKWFGVEPEVEKNLFEILFNKMNEDK